MNRKQMASIKSVSRGSSFNLSLIHISSVLEAGLGWITKLNKKSEFPSQPIFAKQKKEGVAKKLVGFVVDDRRVPRHGYPVCDDTGNEIGVVTSGTSSPTLQLSLIHI